MPDLVCSTCQEKFLRASADALAAGKPPPELADMLCDACVEELLEYGLDQVDGVPGRGASSSSSSSSSSSDKPN